jgi:hypothetical protein
MYKKIAVFCRVCSKKLGYVADINEDEQYRCPYCDSDCKCYHMTMQPSEPRIDISIPTSESVHTHNRYGSVSISIFDSLRQI